MNALSEVMEAGETSDAERLFATEYGRVAALIARVIGDPGRAEARRARYEPLLHLFGRVATPEEIHGANEEQARVRTVLAGLAGRQAELLLLRSEGLTVDGLAVGLVCCYDL